MIASYNRYRVIYDSKRSHRFRMIKNITGPTNIFSLDIMTQQSDHDYISSLVGRFNIGQFTHLRSLILHDVNDLEVQYVLQQISSKSLISLSIQFTPSYSNERTLCSIDNESWALISSSIGQFKLRKIILNNLSCTTGTILWSLLSNELKYLTLGTCSFNQYDTILRQCCNLERFQMVDCLMNNDNDQQSSLLFSSDSSRLESLHISKYSQKIDDLKLLFLLTPALRCLTFGSHRRNIDSMMNGYVWAQMITDYLPLLHDFQFFIHARSSYLARDGNAVIDLLIVPFREIFWLEEKGWITNCCYVFTSSEIVLYTKPYSVNYRHASSLKCEVSSTSPEPRFIQNASWALPDDSEDEVMIN